MKYTLFLLIILQAVSCLTPFSSYSETHPQNSYKKAKSRIKQAGITNNAMNLVQAIEAVGPAVFRINVDYQLPTADPDRPINLKYGGTGFFVGKDGFAVTALHVIHPAEIPENVNPAQITACLAMYAESSGVKSGARFLCVDIDLVDYDSKHDLALLKLRNKNEVPAPVNVSGKEIKPIIGAANMGTRAPKDGTQIAVSGFPLNKPVLITNSGWVASSNGEYVAAGPPPETPEDSGNSDVYLADMRVNSGNDGGPVYSVENGEVIGVGTRFQKVPAEGTNESYIYRSGFSLVTPSKYITELIRKHKLNIK